VGVAVEGPVHGAAGGRVGVGRGGHVQESAEVYAAHTEGGAQSDPVGRAVVRAVEAGDSDVRVGPGDAVVDRGAGVVVVAGAGRERPGTGVTAGVRVCRAAQVEAAQADAANPRGRAGRRVGSAVVGRRGAGVRRDEDAGVGPGDDDDGVAAGRLVIGITVEGP